MKLIKCPFCVSVKCFTDKEMYNAHLESVHLLKPVATHRFYDVNSRYPATRAFTLMCAICGSISNTEFENADHIYKEHYTKVNELNKVLSEENKAMAETIMKGKAEVKELENEIDRLSTYVDNATKRAEKVEDDKETLIKQLHDKNEEMANLTRKLQTIGDVWGVEKLTLTTQHNITEALEWWEKNKWLSSS